MERTTASNAIETDHFYKNLEDTVRDAVQQLSGPLFRTDAQGLGELFVENLDEATRQHYNCRCCKNFIQDYMSLVRISDSMTSHPAILEDIIVPEYFRDAFAEIFERVDKAKIVGVYVPDRQVWGMPKTGAWTHLHGPVGAVLPKNHYASKTPLQNEANLSEDYRLLSRTLHEYPIEAADQAVRVLSADVVDRANKSLDIALWYQKAQQIVAGMKGRQRTNAIWKIVATAPVGWCHVKNTVIGTLMDDIIAGKPFEDIKRAWDAKMHPLKYQRPTALAEGNVTQANKVIEQLGATKSLERRYARRDEILAHVWKQGEAPEAQKSEGGAFDHLLKNQKNKIQPVKLPAKVVDKAEFLKILATAYKVEFQTTAYRQGYFGLVTAVHADAPGLFQWDNTFSWYYVHNGSHCSDWSLYPGQWTNVPMIIEKPCFWGKTESNAEELMLILDGCRPRIAQRGGSFFPENLKSDYREVRKAMEAYSQNAVIAGCAEGDANGISAFGGKGQAQVLVRVNGIDEYILK